MIKDEIKQFITEKFLFNSDDPPGDDVSLLETNIVDSVGILEIVAFLESHFKIKVEDEELTAANLDSINRIANFIEKKRG
ncbi:MAG TPA: acyl carrier protein [Candidatus Saccharicenans sp.]|jgi:acyl carrier protein|nr:acyl carrier protein [Candidatus Saccharicenans sp.]HOJ25995.1 acyl carrier protein [Candidatus Saccharicenans sp.]HOL45537.1 acyl carrier protein [Candidatus Saccharicenans sp.]HOM93804.1 acyl carrier protein [Candidatus Saccharicenans sp.]HOT69284.1 acyl carrier protein [Candidatus Saccharicenans sp.]